METIDLLVIVVVISFCGIEFLRKKKIFTFEKCKSKWYWGVDENDSYGKLLKKFIFRFLIMIGLFLTPLFGLMLISKLPISEDDKIFPILTALVFVLIPVVIWYCYIFLIATFEQLIQIIKKILTK